MKTSVVLALLSAPLFAAGSQEQQYQQVRALALKDAKVQAAYQRAEDKLNERILSIDPSLKSYLEERNRTAKPAAIHAPMPAKKSAVRTVASKTSETSAKSSGVHVVAKGETLAGIAARYHTSAVELQRLNQLREANKLQIGQKLKVPTAKAAAAEPATAPAATPAPSQPASSGTWWERVKSAF